MWPRSVCASRRAGRHRGRASSASLPGSRGSISSSSRTGAASASWPASLRGVARSPWTGCGVARRRSPARRSWPIRRPGCVAAGLRPPPGGHGPRARAPPLGPVSLEGLADAPLDDVEVLLRGPLPAAVFDRLLARCPELRWVHSATAGVERVLTPAARQRGLAITNARGVFSRPIAEYVMLMVLAVPRRLPQLLELQRERTWQPLVAREMRDVTIGVVGLGSIGRAVAALATTFGCRVIATRRRTADGAAPDPRVEDREGQPPA